MFIFYFFYLVGIGATTRTGQEIQCLPYAGFFDGVVPSLCFSIFVFIILVQSYSVHYVFSWLTIGGWRTKTDRHTKEHRYVYTQPAKRIIE